MTQITQTAGGSGAAVADKLIELACNAVGQFTSISRYEDFTFMPRSHRLRMLFAKCSPQFALNW